MACGAGNSFPLFFGLFAFVQFVSVVSCQHKCQPLTIHRCKSLNYSSTMFPNFENHSSQVQAVKMIQQLNPLFNIQCSPDLVYFACFYYAPFCNSFGKPLPPCRSLCKRVRKNCIGILRKFGFDWPYQLRCKKFPLDGSTETCVGRN